MWFSFELLKPACTLDYFLAYFKEYTVRTKKGGIFGVLFFFKSYRNKILQFAIKLFFEKLFRLFFDKKPFFQFSGLNCI